MLIDKKRRVIALKIIAVPAKRRIKKYSSTHGGGGTAVLFIWEFRCKLLFGQVGFSYCVTDLQDECRGNRKLVYAHA